MSSITIVDRDRLSKLATVSKGQRLIVVNGLLNNEKDETIDAAIEAAGTKQTGAYVRSYYLSELRKAGIVEGYAAGAKSGRGAVRAILEAKN